MPTNFKEIMQFMKMAQGGGNPQQFILNMLNERAQTSNDPLMKSLLQSAKSGNQKEIENIARNITKEKGIDFDKEFNSFKQMFGL